MTLRPTRWNILLAGLLLVLLTCLPGVAKADCSTTSGAANLGPTRSFVAASTVQTATASSGFACSGSALSLVSTNTITATITAVTNSDGAQPRLYNGVSGDYIPYSICKDSGCGATYPVGSQITWSSTTFLGILGLFNASGGTLPLYIRTIPGTQVAPGTYTSTITINWSWHLCALGAFGICVYDDGTATSTVAVTMTVDADCVISAPSTTFGSAAFVGSFDPVTQTLTIRCSKDAAYTVGIDDGQHYSGSRRLANGGNYIAYEIYFPEGSNNRWGSLAAERRSSAQATTNAGVYTGTTDQTFTYRAEILTGQTTPPPGVYTDTLVVDVQF